ncbi:MAG: hypothetical protein KKF48_01595 [Nanoarchaeota archaeon]|nr:hypothetical protein [Nanoarchaeota archaeon]MBU1027715.1 hypothetical protein [Nanoarchaeota archaeon]
MDPIWKEIREILSLEFEKKSKKELKIQVYQDIRNESLKSFAQFKKDLIRLARDLKENYGKYRKREFSKEVKYNLKREHLEGDTLNIHVAKYLLESINTDFYRVSNEFTHYEFKIFTGGGISIAEINRIETDSIEKIITTYLKNPKEETILTAYKNEREKVVDPNLVKKYLMFKLVDQKANRLNKIKSINPKRKKDIKRIHAKYYLERETLAFSFSTNELDIKGAYFLSDNYTNMEIKGQIPASKYIELFSEFTPIGPKLKGASNMRINKKRKNRNLEAKVGLYFFPETINVECEYKRLQPKDLELINPYFD